MTIDDALVVEEYARLHFGYEDWETLTTEHIKAAWDLLHPLSKSGG